MIRDIASIEACRDFLESIRRDPVCCCPSLSAGERIEDKLLRALNKPGDRVLGAYENGVLTGVFVFLILPEERYLEMLTGLSPSAAAWEEIAAWLEVRCPGYQADFVFSPENALLRALLERKGAFFNPEQQKMVFAGPLPQVDTAGIEPLGEATLPQYLAMHDRDLYWTGERVIETPERFRVLLAVEAGQVLGYADVTCCYEENEPVDLLVLKERRGQGWGRKLLAKALDLNAPKGMSLLVDLDNIPALRLYESLGFAAVPGRNSITATWQIPEGR